MIKIVHKSIKSIKSLAHHRLVRIPEGKKKAWLLARPFRLLHQFLISDLVLFIIYFYWQLHLQNLQGIL